MTPTPGVETSSPLLKLALLLLRVPQQVMGASQCPAPGGLRVLRSEGFAGKHSPWGHLKWPWPLSRSEGQHAHSSAFWGLPLLLPLARGPLPDVTPSSAAAEPFGRGGPDPARAWSRRGHRKGPRRGVQPCSALPRRTFPDSQASLQGRGRDCSGHA